MNSALKYGGVFVVFVHLIVFIDAIVTSKKIMSTPSPRTGAEQNMALDSCPYLKMSSFLHLVTTLVLSCA